MTRYTTRNEAIEREIIAPLKACPALDGQYTEDDIDAIASTTIFFDGFAFECVVGPEEFWDAVWEVLP